MTTKDTYFYAIGRRKGAVAQIKLIQSKGNITINHKPLEEVLMRMRQQKRRKPKFLKERSHQKQTENCSGRIAGMCDQCVSIYLPEPLES